MLLLLIHLGRHGGAVVSTAASKQEDHEPGIFSLCLRVLYRFSNPPPPVQNYSCEVNWELLVGPCDKLATCQGCQTGFPHWLLE